MNKSDFIEHLKPLLPAGGDASELETAAQALAGLSLEDRDLLAAVHEYSGLREHPVRVVRATRSVLREPPFPVVRATRIIELRTVVFCTNLL